MVATVEADVSEDKTTEYVDKVNFILAAAERNNDPWEVMYANVLRCVHHVSDSDTDIMCTDFTASMLQGTKTTALEAYEGD